MSRRTQTKASALVPDIPSSREIAALAHAIAQVSTSTSPEFAVRPVHDSDPPYAVVIEKAPGASTVRV
jgi:hypothetical protein